MLNEPIIDAVIPVYHPQRRFLALLRMLAKQEMPLRRIRVINTDREIFLAFLHRQGMKEKDFLAAYPFVTLEHIRPSEFDHGGTRNKGIRECLDDTVQVPASHVLLMTQDALPRNRRLTKELFAAFSLDDRIEAAYARQLANKNAKLPERISREFNYPDAGSIQVKSQEDFSRLGIKTYFCSNVCAMYRLDVWQQLGGFPEHMIFNEDMVYAGTALQHGWKIAYVPAACVYHSHNYTAGQQFHRNFDLGVSQADHPEIFTASRAQESSEGEGLRYVRNVAHALRKQGAGLEIPVFLYTCGCRYLGYRLGKDYRKLPPKLVRDFSDNKNYWKQ